MAKKKTAKKKPSESAYPYSYPRVYSLVLWNTGEEDHGGTFCTIRSLVDAEIERIDNGEESECDLKSLLIIRDQLDEEFTKGRDSSDG